eukprot:scaffold97344_cov30-Phaeocystis_antarctica.AAC.1
MSPHRKPSAAEDASSKHAESETSPCSRSAAPLGTWLGGEAARHLELRWSCDGDARQRLRRGDEHMAHGGGVAAEAVSHLVRVRVRIRVRVRVRVRVKARARVRSGLAPSAGRRTRHR